MWIEPIISAIKTGEVAKVQTAISSWSFLQEFVDFIGIHEQYHFGRVGLATRALLTAEMAELIALGMTLGVLHA